MNCCIYICDDDDVVLIQSMCSYGYHGAMQQMELDTSNPIMIIYEFNIRTQPCTHIYI